MASGTVGLMSDTNNEEGRWLEGLDERTEQERMVEFHAEELPDFWTWLRDQKLPMEGDTISLRRVESLVHQAWVAGAALSFRPPVPAESSEGVWTCGHCGRSSEAHGMPEHPAYQCVYAPVWKPLDPVTPQVTSPFKSLPENLNAEARDSSSPQVTSDPSDDELHRIESEAIIDHWGGDAIALANARQSDIDAVARRAIWNAALARPSVEGEGEALALAEYRAKIQDEDEAIQKIQRTDPFVIASIFNAGWQAHG